VHGNAGSKQASCKNKVTSCPAHDARETGPSIQAGVPGAVASDERKKTMVSCEHVLNELSNFIDGDIDPSLRAEIESHLKMCRRCSVLQDSLRKMLVIVADERTFEIPIGYSERLHAYINRQIG
jgi:hypothetical protein